MRRRNHFILYAQGLFHVVKKGRIIRLKIFNSTIKLSSEVFSSTQTMAKKTFLSKWKISSRNILQWATCFLFATQTLHTNDFEMKLVRDKKWQMSFPFSENASLWKTKLSNIGWMLLFEFVCTFYFYWFQPKWQELSHLIFFWRWNSKRFELNLTYPFLLHWIGAINRQGNNMVKKSVSTFLIYWSWLYMLFCHLIIQLQTERNFLNHLPLVWSIRKTSQTGGSKNPLRHFF